MIRVDTRRLDLHALDDREEIRILTGSSGVQILAADHAGAIPLSITPTGTGERWPEQDGAKNRWLNLAALDPLRMYRLTAHRGDRADRGSVVVHFRDITPTVPDKRNSGPGRKISEGLRRK